MKTDGHYDVTYWKHGARNGQINALVCLHCGFFEKVADHRRATDRSGLPRYNRARAEMIRHLHRLHRERLAEGLTREVDQ